MKGALPYLISGLIAVLGLSACGGNNAAPPSASTRASTAAASSGASPRPQTSGSAAASAATSAKPGSSGAASVAPAPPDTIVASYSELTAINLPVWYAADEGIFKKHGLNVDLRLIESSLGVGALLSDEVKFAAMGGSETLAAAVNGADLKVLATLSPYYPYKLEVNSSIKTAQDLKGKKIGISRIGSSSDSATRAALSKLSLNPDKDVTFIQIGSLSARTAALLSGSLDAGVDALPDTLNLEAHGFHPLFDLAAAKLPAVNNTLVARGGWVEENKDTVQKYVDSVVESIARAKADKSTAIQLMRKYLKERAGNDQALSETFDFYANSEWQIPPKTTPDLFQDSLTLLAKKTSKAKGFDINKVIDNSFAENAAAKFGGTS